MITKPGFKTYLLMWFGQLVSVMGTQMTRFAVITWAYQQTGDATTLALLGFFSFLPYVLVSPIAGVLVDRFDRRIVMMCADLGAGLMTVGMFLLYAMGGLQIWHLYVAEALTGVFDAFFIPAHNAAVTTLVPKEHYTRVSGMRSLLQTISQVVAPFAAGALLPFISLGGVMLIDITTFVFAVGVMLALRFPAPPVSKDGEEARGNFWREVRFGFSYIWQRKGLLGLLMIYTGINFGAALTYFGVMSAMVLTRSGGSELALASVQAAMGIGGVIGGLIYTAWGGPKRKIHGLLIATTFSYLLGDFLFAVGRTPVVWMVAGFLAAIFIPVIVGSNKGIWQVKVAPDVQGRVFAVQALFEQISLPIGYLLAGPLADRVFGPAMMPDGALANVFGWLVGTGPGAGMGLMFIFTWIMGVSIGLGGFLIPAVRRVELDLPDHDLLQDADEQEVDMTELAEGTAAA